MRCKIFHNNSNDEEELEDQVNEWLEENPNIKIVDSAFAVTITPPKLFREGLGLATLAVFYDIKTKEDGLKIAT